jgi:hypothetical protein
MTSPGTTGHSTVGAISGAEPDDRVDAIRYAVLRKLAPGLRHALMWELQAIQLSAEFAARVLRAGVDVAAAHDSLGRIPHQCSDAVRTGRSLIEWLQPERGASVSVGECVRQCLRLAGEDWFLRGIEATADVPDADIQVSKAALQEVLVTALLVLTYMYNQCADLHVSVRTAQDHVDVVVRARTAERSTSIPPTLPYRKLGWADLKLLADVHSVPCVCEDPVNTRTNTVW